MVTSRVRPIRKIGIRSTSLLRCVRRDRAPRALQGDRQGISQGRLRRNSLQVYAEVHDRLGDLWAHAADDAVGTHESDGGHCFQQVLRDERIDRRYSGDVNDCNRRARFHDALEQTFHHDLRTRAVERADHREREDPFPELYHGGRKLEHLLLLSYNDLFTRILERLDRQESKLVDELIHFPQRTGEPRRVLNLATEHRLQRFLQREYERRSLAGAVSLARPFVRKLVKERSDGLPGFGVKVVHLPALGGVSQQSQKVLRLSLQLPGFVPEIPSGAGSSQTCVPETEQLVAVRSKHVNRTKFRGSHRASKH